MFIGLIKLSSINELNNNQCIWLITDALVSNGCGAVSPYSPLPNLSPLISHPPQLSIPLISTWQGIGKRNLFPALTIHFLSKALTGVTSSIGHSIKISS